MSAHLSAPTSRPRHWRRSQPAAGDFSWMPRALSARPPPGRSKRRATSATLSDHRDPELNDEEAETLVGSADPKGSARSESRGVLTLGAKGSFIVTPDLIEHVAAIEVDGPVDPTGAGDTFSVAYLTRRANGANPVEAAQMPPNGRHASRKRVRRQEAVRPSPVGRYSLNSPRATTTARPPTSTRWTPASLPSARAYSVDGRPISSPWEISISVPHGTRPCLQTWHASGLPRSRSRDPRGLQRRREHARLPRCARTCDAAEVRLEVSERREVRAQTSDGLMRVEHDEGMDKTVVVALDR